MRIIAGSAKGSLLKSPKGRKVRPTAEKVKAAFFNIIAKYIEDVSLLDLFAGTGSVGIEGLSRGAQRCVFVEKDSRCIQILRENLCRAGFLEKGEIFPCNINRALKILAKRDDSFQVVYIDPPYRYPDILGVLTFLKENMLVADKGIVCVERNSREKKVWLDSSPFQLWQRKTYGDTELLLFTVG